MQLDGTNRSDVEVVRVMEWVWRGVFDTDGVYLARGRSWAKEGYDLLDEQATVSQGWEGRVNHTRTTKRRQMRSRILLSLQVLLLLRDLISLSPSAFDCLDLGALTRRRLVQLNQAWLA